MPHPRRRRCRPHHHHPSPLLRRRPWFRRLQRLRWARRLGLPLMPAFLLGAVDPVAVARRLQIPGKQQQWLQQCGAIRDWLTKTPPPFEASPSIWSMALEKQGWQPEAVALVVTLKPQQWKLLLRWWGRWRRIQAPQTARDLIAAGWQQGPAHSMASVRRTMSGWRDERRALVRAPVPAVAATTAAAAAERGRSCSWR